MPSDSSSNSPSRFQKWWRDGDNARRVLDKRRTRYHQDAQYRESIKESVKRQRQEKSGSPGKRGYGKPRIMEFNTIHKRAISTGEAADRIGISRSTLIRWSKQKVVPSIFIRGDGWHRWWMEEIIDKIAVHVKEWKDSKDRSLSDLKKRVSQDKTLFDVEPDRGV